VSHEPQLSGQTLVVIGGSSGIGLETARRARAEGAEIIITARNADRLHRAGLDLRARIAAFDATNSGRLQRFFAELPAPIDHVLVAGPRRCHANVAEFEVGKARSEAQAHCLLPLQVARNAASTVRPGGTLLFLDSTGGRHPAAGDPLASVITAALAALTKRLALEVAPVRVNLIATGFVDTPPAEVTVNCQRDAPREQPPTMLPIRRFVGPDDIAALAVHLMTNTAITGATVEIDGGQQLIQPYD
jgi:NAD(P)-dependent dehydrogenase (short-subunit alcohol dehydrogenase family)